MLVVYLWRFKHIVTNSLILHLLKGEVCDLPLETRQSFGTILTIVILFDSWREVIKGRAVSALPTLTFAVETWGLRAVRKPKPPGEINIRQLVNSPYWAWGQMCEWRHFRKCQPQTFESFQLKSQAWMKQRKNITPEPWKNSSLRTCGSLQLLLVYAARFTVFCYPKVDTQKTALVGGGENTWRYFYMHGCL